MPDVVFQDVTVSPGPLAERHVHLLWFAKNLIKR
jgi:hypothetical protein